MLVYFLVKMTKCLLVLCPVLLAAGVLTLSIDSELGTSIEDCFERISIGEKPPRDSIYRNVSELTSRECEQICKQDKQCQTYAYGVGAKGNATCDLSNLDEKELKEKKMLLKDPDYDVYVRRIQCEQSPPSPLQPVLNDTVQDLDGLNLKPIHRPGIDDASGPLLDEYPQDSRPFETIYPGFRPQPPYGPSYQNYIDRPLEFYSPRPDDRPPGYGLHRPPDTPVIPERPGQNLDRPPSYGGHRPQEIPFIDRPEYPNDRPPSYGVHKPQDIPFRPQRPQLQYQNFTNPDPYDILYFQDGRPRPPPNWRPDPYYPPSPQDDIPDLYGVKPDRPLSPPVRPQVPPYDYVRPNRRPNRPEDFGYARPPNYPARPDPYAPNPPIGPVGPPLRPYKPSRPFDSPSNRPTYDYYGQYASNYGQNQNVDNSIYTEIYDPPRPYRPKPRPEYERPIYGPGQQYGQNFGYGQLGDNVGGSYQQSQAIYGEGTITQIDDQNRPHKRPKPVQGPPNYGSHDPIKPSYDTPSVTYGGLTDKPVKKPVHVEKPIHSLDTGYGSIQDSKPQRPLDAPVSTYDDSSNSQLDSYSYGISQKPQDSYRPPNNFGYGSHLGYGLQEIYHTSQNKPFNDNRPSYGNIPNHDDVRPSYGINRPVNDRPLYNGEDPIYDVYNRPNRPSYGSTSNSDSPTYNKPNNYRPPYTEANDVTPSFNRPNIERPPHNRPDDIRPSYNRPDDDRPSYNPPNVDRPSYNRPNDDRPSYNKPIDEIPSYNNPINDRPDDPASYGTEIEDTGYKNNQKKNNTNQDYKPQSVKPVYEYESEKPVGAPSFIVGPGGEVITSKPVSVGDFGGYGREPGAVSYEACFRRVLAGKRALRSHVRRVAPCERLEDCRRECAEERRFHCESFNYRLDPSFRGKGLCELMTKPIEAFDLRRDFIEDKDYDFYEVDRNSLEPHCPETLRGPGFLHSGFLSSKTSTAVGEYQGWRDRTDWSGQRRYSSHDDRRDIRPPIRPYRRRYEEPYIPYQIGMARTNNDQEIWGQYGGSYGGNTYYKDRNDYHKSLDHWRLNDYHPTYGVKPYNPYHMDSHEFNYHDLGRDSWVPGGYKRYGDFKYSSWKRGRWPDEVGNGLDYGESNYYKKPHSYGPEGRGDEVVIKERDPPDCSSRRQPGMSLGSGAIRRSLFAENVVECEAACFEERDFKCVSYSYRYSSTHGSDNCFLSERPYRGLQLSADSSSDVYAMPQDSGCSVSSEPLVESECFWHVRSGAAVGGPAARAALTVTGLGACEAECIRAHDFFCRGFSFRFEAPTIGDDLENCILTSSPPTSLEVGRGLHPNSGHELYARGNYGRGCEPALYDDDTEHKETGECYLQYDSAAKLIGAAVKGQARTKDERSCGKTCTEAPFRCLSFSFNNNAPPDTDNCYLSEIRLFDLQRGVDYEHSDDHWLFAFDLFNGQCWRKVHGRESHDEPVAELPRPLPAPPAPRPPPAPSGPSAPTGYLPAPREPTYIPGSGPPSGPGYPKPVYGPPAQYPVYPDSGPGYPSGAAKPVYLPTGPKPYPPEYDRPDPDYRPTGPHRPHIDPVPPSGPVGPSGGFKPVYGPTGPLVPEYPGSGHGYPERGHGYPERGHGYPGSGHGYPGSRPGYPGRPVASYPNEREEPIGASWGHYTVSGFPCRKGTVCAQNVVAGHWACEPEGGEIGAWDYCCAPTHRCGYSEGFHKPWCYVGPSQDQWRPCSEKYYPYHQHNVPHPSQGHRQDFRPPKPYPARPYERPPDGYLPEGDRRYWDELYRNGPKAYYDKYGNPLPGYSRVPMEARPYIKYNHRYPPPGSGQWVPVPPPHQQELEPPVPGGLGVPRYWPVAYLHKGPPPNITYFKYNDTSYTTTERRTDPPTTIPMTPSPPKEQPPQNFNKVNPDSPSNNNIDKQQDDKTKNMTRMNDDIFTLNLNENNNTNSSLKSEAKTDLQPIVVQNQEIDEKKANISETDSEKNITESKRDTTQEQDDLKGIDAKLTDFSSSIEVLDIEDAKKGEKIADLKTLEAEERQIEAIGRLLASKRGQRLVIEKRSQKELESKNIALDKDLIDFNFNNRFPTKTERRATVQKVTREEIERDKHIDRSLEVSETTFVRPPRVLSTTENIRKAVVNGKVFYSASGSRDFNNVTAAVRKVKSLRPLEERAPSVIGNNNFGKKKVVRVRNVSPTVNPVRKVRRVYRRKYNPDEVRRRLLERERSMKEKDDSRKV